MKMFLWQHVTLKYIRVKEHAKYFVRSEFITNKNSSQID